MITSVTLLCLQKAYFLGIHKYTYSWIRQTQIEKCSTEQLAHILQITHHCLQLKRDYKAMAAECMV